MSRDFTCIWLGRRPYGPVHELQLHLAELRKASKIGDCVLLLEHEAVVTQGRGARAEHLLATADELRRHSVELAPVGRGGDVTLHAPGQLVAYPILNLAPERCDVRRYVNDLVETMRLMLGDWGIAAGSWQKYVGLWVDKQQPLVWRGAENAAQPCKVGAIGVRISRWVTLHGFCLNLSVNLDLYRLIVPCGIREFGVTSLQQLTGNAPDVEQAASRAATHLVSVFGATLGKYLDRSAEPLERIAAELASYGPANAPAL